MNYLDTRLKDIKNGYIQHFGMPGMKWGWTKDGKRTGAKEAMTEQELMLKRLNYIKKNKTHDYEVAKNFVNKYPSTRLKFFGLLNRKNHNKALYNVLNSYNNFRTNIDTNEQLKKINSKKNNKKIIDRKYTNYFGEDLVHLYSRGKKNKNGYYRYNAII